MKGRALTASDAPSSAVSQEPELRTCSSRRSQIACRYVGEGGRVADVEPPRARQRYGDLADYPAGRRAHDDDAVGEIDRLVDIVGDEEDRLAVALPDAQELRAHDLPDLRVERTERLVHQQYLGLDAQGAGDSDALAHAA